MIQEFSASTQQEGGCHCGAIHYRITAKPITALACHCTNGKLCTGVAYGERSFDDPDWYDIAAPIGARSARYDMHYPEAMPVSAEVLRAQ